MHHPPPDPLKKSANLFERIDYLVKAVLYLVEEALNTRHAMEAHAMTTSDFQGSLDRNTAATTASTAASAQERAQLQAVSQQLADAVAQLSTSQAPTQAQLDQLNAASQALEEATAADVADDAPAT